jgi:uncharacterized protein (TIGR00251 family)
VLRSMEPGLSTVRDDGTIELSVHAQPGAGRTQITGRHGSALKIRVAVPPEHGRANEALTAALATAFNVPATAIALVSGERSRSKRFQFRDIDADTFEARLAELVAGVPAPGGQKRAPNDRRPDPRKG